MDVLTAPLPLYDLRTCAFGALLGAKRHLHTLGGLAVGRPPTEEPRAGRFHLALRSLLWELGAAFDTSLVYLDRLLGTGVGDFDEVRWPALERAASREGKWTPALDAVDRAWRSEWFCELRACRRAATRTFYLVDGVGTVGRVRWSWDLEADPDGGRALLDRPRSFVAGMEDLLETVFDRPVS